MQKTGKTEKKKVILALQGGGAYGAFTWGVIERLLEDDRIEIVGVTGSSMGAINAAALAYGLDKGGKDGAKKALQDVWEALETGDLWDDVFFGKYLRKIGRFSKRYLPNFTKRISKTSKLSIMALFNHVASKKQAEKLYARRMQKKLSSVIDFEALRNNTNGIPLYVNATDILSHGQTIFSRETISADAIAASCAIPGVFPSVMINGRPHVDGGLSENPPFSPIKDIDASDIIVIQNTSLAPLKETPPRNRIKRSDFSEHFLSASINKNIEDIHRDNIRVALDPAAAARFGIKHFNTHLIHDHHEMKHYGVLTALKFEDDIIQEYREVGYHQAKLWLDKHFVSLGKRSSYKPVFTKKAKLT